MGLSGNNPKQRIQDDPRNVRWAQDTSAPGFRLLSQMGWTAAAPSLGLATSQDLITAGGSSAFNKKISVIPTAKSDNLGIGARGGGGIGSLRMMGLPAGASGFVSASVAGEGAVTEAAPAKGGEFGRLLERLNAASAAASAATTAAGSEAESVEEELDEKALRKKEKREKKERKELKRAAKEEKKRNKRKAEDSSDDESTPVPSTSASPAVLVNPRNAARSKHLRAKRMASSMDASAMAEILGIAPPSTVPIVSAPRVLPGSIPSIPFATAPLEVSPPTVEGWPEVPKRAFPMFAASSTSGLKATFEEVTVVTEVVVVPTETEEEQRKREKKAKKEAKRLLKDGGDVQVEEPTPVKAFPGFASSTTTSLAATFVVETVTEVVVPVEDAAAVEAERKRAKKERKEAKRSKVAA